MSSTLTHSVAAIISQLLIDEGLIPTGASVHVNFRPAEAADYSVLVSDTESRGLQKDMPGYTSEGAGIQIRIKGPPHEQLIPRGHIVAIDEQLATLTRYQLSYDGSTYLIAGIHRTSAVLPLPMDEHHCWEWSWNGVVRLREL